MDVASVASPMQQCRPVIPGDMALPSEKGRRVAHECASSLTEVVAVASPVQQCRAHSSSSSEPNPFAMRCLICFHEYAMPAKVPKVLPCGHTFCGECITLMIRVGTLTCPTCRATARAAGPGQLFLARCPFFVQALPVVA